jgi:hypothetical protein
MGQVSITASSVVDMDWDVSFYETEFHPMIFPNRLYLETFRE